jgi:hypothetical protein
LKQKELREIEERIEEIVEGRMKEFEEEKIKYKQLVDKKIEEKEIECTLKIKQNTEENLRFSN